MDGEAITANHPLDPYSGEELTRAAEILRESGEISDASRFSCALPIEPAKEFVKTFEPGSPFERQVRLIGHDRERGSSFDARVSLSKGKLEEFSWVESGQASVSGSDAMRAFHLIHASPDWQAALRKRGIEDSSLVQIDPWVAGVQPEGMAPNARVLAGVAFLHEDPEDKCSSGPLSTDTGDTVLQASLLGAGRIIRDLVGTGTRVTVMKFAERAQGAGVVDGPTSARDLVAHVCAVSQRTALGSAIRAALRSLDEEPTTAAGERWIVLISDGVPTYPLPEIFALRDTLRAVAKAAARGVRIYAFGLGKRHGALTKVVQMTGGALVQVHGLEDFTAPNRLCLVPSLNAAIINRTSGALGRAVRLFADGSFDGVVPLVPGNNIVEVGVTLASGESHTAERRVHFEPRPSRTMRELQSLRELRDRIQLRSQETRLLVDTNRRSLLLRSLEIRPAPASVFDPIHPED